MVSETGVGDVFLWCLWVRGPGFLFFLVMAVAPRVYKREKKWAMLRGGSEEHKKLTQYYAKKSLRQRILLRLIRSDGWGKLFFCPALHIRIVREFLHSARSKTHGGMQCPSSRDVREISSPPPFSLRAPTAENAIFSFPNCPPLPFPECMQSLPALDIIASPKNNGRGKKRIKIFPFFFLSAIFTATFPRESFRFPR